MVETTTNNRSAVSAAKNPGLTGYKNVESSYKEPGWLCCIASAV